jgi:hypothetical protein
LLQTLWAWPHDLRWMPSKTKGKEMVGVVGSALSLFGASTLNKLMLALTMELVGNGFLNRWLFFNVGGGAPAPVKPKYSSRQMPRALQAALAAGAKHAQISLREVPVEEAHQEHHWRRIGWGDGVYDLWFGWVVAIRAMPTDDKELWIRAPELALRVATVEADWRGANVVDVVGWEWARALVTGSMQQLAAAIRESMSDNLKTAELCDVLRAEFQKEKHKVATVDAIGRTRRVGRLTLGDITRLLERKTDDHRKIPGAIAHLVACGDIVELLDWKGPGRPTRRWKNNSSKSGLTGQFDWPMATETHISYQLR